MRRAHRFRRAAVAVAFIALASWLPLAMALDAGPQRVGALPPGSSFSQFIVKYRDGTGAGAASETAALRGAATAAQLPAAAVDARGDDWQFAWQRRLGVGADVFRVAPGLDRAESQQLLDLFASDPDVEYVQVDSMMRTLQAPPPPVAGSAPPR